MKAITLTLLLAFFFAAPSFAQKVNDAVEIQSSGTWYPGKVLKVDGEKFFVAYEGWDESWNEWVGKDRLRGSKTAAAPAPAAPLTKFKVGDKVEAEYGMIWEPATIIEAGENKYHIQFDKKTFGTKWLGEKMIRKL